MLAPEDYLAVDAGATSVKAVITGAMSPFTQAQSGRTMAARVPVLNLRHSSVTRRNTHHAIVARLF